jgi:hypothetical protein
MIVIHHQNLGHAFEEILFNCLTFNQMWLIVFVDDH